MRRIMGNSHLSSWISLARAAEILGEPEGALQKKLARASRRAPDGVVEASISGITARKLGRNWKVRLGARWMEGTEP